MSKGIISVIFSRYGETKYPDSFSNLRRFLQTKFSGCDFRYYIGDNDNFVNLSESGSSSQKISVYKTSNSAFEFSSWDEVYNTNYYDIIQSEFVFFVSSAWQEMYTSYLNFFDYKILELILSHQNNFAIGHIDEYDIPGTLMGKHISHWIRTSFFIMTPKLPRLIGGLTTLHHSALVNKFILQKGLKPKFDFMNSNYFNNIFNWLTGTSMQGSVWHSKFNRNSINFNDFSRKFLSIANEHLLTKRLEECNFGVFDVCFINIHKKFNVSVENQIKLRNMYLKESLKNNIFP
jgi:hypothetical protein